MPNKKTEAESQEEAFVARMLAKKQPENAVVEPCTDCPNQVAWGTDEKKA